MTVRSSRYVPLLMAIAALLLMPSSAYADSSKSANYQFDQGTVGTSGYLDANSANYSATSATSDIAAGAAASSNYQIQDGTKTTNDPTLSFSISNGTLSLGSFSAAVAASTTASFSVSNYSSYGYVVTMIGTPPTNGAKTIAGLSTADISRPGVEQFGINLVANTSPSSLGANPDNGGYGFGAAATNYNTANQFRFVSGDTIAQAPKSSGVTNYTISYIVNVAGQTPGGQYVSNQTLLVTGTY